MKLLSVDTTTTATSEYSKTIHFLVTNKNYERTFKFVNLNQDKDHCVPYLFRNEVFGWLKTHNPFADYDNTTFMGFIAESMEDYENSTQKTHTLLLVCVYDHTLYLEDYTPVPFLLRFDYLSGCCSSENFNLDESVKTLEKLENVTCISISKVDWYNQNNKEDLMSLNFSLLPTVSMLQHVQILEKTQNYVDRKAGLTRLLGLTRLERSW